MPCGRMSVPPLTSKSPVMVCEAAPCVRAVPKILVAAISAFAARSSSRMVPCLISSDVTDVLGILLLLTTDVF